LSAFAAPHSRTRFISDASLARNYFDRVVNFRKGYLDVLAIGYTNNKQ